jgi:hypothetical protein
MRKGWLIAAAISGVAGVSQAAEVQIFGIHSPDQGKWAVYARISNTASSAGGGLTVSGLDSIAVDVTNNTTGSGSANVTSAKNTLPSGTTTYKDTTIFPGDGSVGYGFWVVNSNGTTDATGIHGISGAQFAIYPRPTTTVPYQNLVLGGVGVSRGGQVTTANITKAQDWDLPVQIASGSYTPSATTGAGSQVGLNIGYSAGTGVNFVRKVGNDWVVEGVAPGGATAIDARTFTGVPGAGAGGTTIKAGAGDADLNGVVDFNDLVHLAQNYNTTTANGGGRTWFNGDFNYDGSVDFNDLVMLAQHYTLPVPSQPIGSAAFEGDLARAFAEVPEPTSLGFVGLCLVGLARRTRK